jgi:hypothetical protein
MTIKQRRLATKHPTTTVDGAEDRERRDIETPDCLVAAVVVRYGCSISSPGGSTRSLWRTNGRDRTSDHEPETAWYKYGRKKRRFLYGAFVRCTFNGLHNDEKAVDGAGQKTERLRRRVVWWWWRYDTGVRSILVPLWMVVIMVLWPKETLFEFSYVVY